MSAQCPTALANLGQSEHPCMHMHTERETLVTFILALSKTLTVHWAHQRVVAAAGAHLQIK